MTKVEIKMLDIGLRHYAKEEMNCENDCLGCGMCPVGEVLKMLEPDSDDKRGQKDGLS